MSVHARTLEPVHATAHITWHGPSAERPPACCRRGKQASRHDESQTTPRQKAQHPGSSAPGPAEGHFEPAQPLKYGGAPGVVNINASAVAGHAGYGSEPGSARQGGGYGIGPASARGPPLYGGSGAGPSHAAAPSPAKHWPPGLPGGGGSGAAAGGQGGVGAPRPLQLPPMFARDPPLPLPTARKLGPPAASGKQLMTARVAPLGASPYLAPVPGYQPHSSRPAAAPAAAAAAPQPGYARPAAAQPQELRPVPALPLGAQPPASAAMAAAPTARSTKARADIYARMSQGLPAMESPRTARAQQLLRQPAVQLPAATAAAAPNVAGVPQAQLQPVRQLQPRPPLSYAGIPLDSPSSSTGLTPRTARLMQRLPVGAPGAAAPARTHLAPPPGAAPQQPCLPEAGPYSGQQQGYTAMVGQASVPQPGYQPFLGQQGGAQPPKQAAAPHFAGEKRQSLDAEGVCGFDAPDTVDD